MGEVRRGLEEGASCEGYWKGGTMARSIKDGEGEEGEGGEEGG